MNTIHIQKVLRWGLLGLSLAACQIAHSDSRPGAFVSVPVTFLDAAGKPVAAERGLLLVPENRRDPRSRLIAIHFVRFRALSAPARSDSTPRAPVILLAGGPGSELDFNDPIRLRDVDLLRRTRDLVYVSQRGNPAAAGLVPNMLLQTDQAPLDEPASAARTKVLQQAALQKALSQWTRKGVDVTGYDILNIVDDVYDLRAALGYDRIVLRGCSFGSQWSLSYLKRWPQTVDRALLSGVEPLDYAYDSPKWLWASMSRLAKMADSDSRLAPHIPAGGVLHALQEVIQRLEKQPARVAIVSPAGDPVEIVIGADDVRALLDGAGLPGKTARDRLANWPRFILEMLRGDYRHVAARVWQLRTSGYSGKLILPLIDNSLGITAARDAKLLAEPEARWLGDINDFYRNTRDLTPTPRVGDEFRADSPIDVPVLLINGDLDWSTPMENARHLRRHLERGHLVSVSGGTHCGEIVEMQQMQPGKLQSLYEFIDADFATTAPEAVLARLPDHLAYPAIQFQLPLGPSLYEQGLLEKTALERRTVPGIELELMPIPAGQFVMGSPADEPGRETDEEPQTQVTISKPFWLGRYEVTHGQWRALMGTDLTATAARIFADQTIHDTGKRQLRTLQMNVEDGGDVSGPEVLLGDTGDSVPMYLVSWVDAMAFCEALNKRERQAGRLPAGYVYRLPTDAEWEYAARAGTTGAIYRGTLEILGESNAPALDPLAWYAGNSTLGYTGRGFNVAAYRAERQYSATQIAGPRLVGLKEPNAWGLHDMIGNVWEWAMDWYERPLVGGAVVDPTGPASGRRRVVRGGGWDNPVFDNRSAQRFGVIPEGGRLINLGFRVALAPQLPPP
jgi:formylglycine-generating enzyme required for sulfatase activity/pimeloyl-ACP methyl ester carboxylesterase